MGCIALCCTALHHMSWVALVCKNWTYKLDVQTPLWKTPPGVASQHLCSCSVTRSSCIVSMKLLYTRRRKYGVDTLIVAMKPMCSSQGFAVHDRGKKRNCRKRGYYRVLTEVHMPASTYLVQMKLLQIEYLCSTSAAETHSAGWKKESGCVIWDFLFITIYRLIMIMSKIIYWWVVKLFLTLWWEI